MYDLHIILSLYVLETTNVLILSPLVPFLLLHYGVIDNLDNSSIYSGYFSTVYFIGQLLCNYPMCYLAERYGKKYVILFGTFTTICFNILFLFSNNLYTSLLIRFLYGLCNANFCLLRVIIADVSKKEDISANYAYLTCAWAVGAFTAPLMSMTYDGNSKFPAMYPMLISSATTFVIFVVAMLFMDNPVSVPSDIIQENKDENATGIAVPQITVVVVAIYLLFSMMETIYGEILPVLFTSKQYQYTERQIGLLFAINNFIGFITSLFFDRILKWIGRKDFMYTSLILIEITLLAISFTHLYVLLCIFTSAHNMLSNWIFSIIFIYLGSVPNINKINGITQTLGSLTKIMSPVVFTYLFHYLKNDINIIFAIVTTIALFITVITSKI